MTILEALQWGERELKSTAHEKVIAAHNAKLDAQVLLSFCLKKPSAYTFAHMNESVAPEKLHQYKTYIIRRKQHEPIAYIIGEREFYKRRFIVNPSVLIPRPETELMIDLAKEYYQINDVLVEVGTGSGAISITLALELEVQLFASDISKEAINIAEVNAKNQRANSSIHFEIGDLLLPYIQQLNENNSTQSGRTLLFANLPYVTLRAWEETDPDVKIFEPKTALVSGIDGLDHYDRLLQQIKTFKHLLKSQLILFFEIDPSQELTLPSLISDHFAEATIAVHHDLQNHPRIVQATILLH